MKIYNSFFFLPSSILKGEGDDNLYCVRFGMVTEDTDMEELIDLIVSTGQEIEEATKVCDLSFCSIFFFIFKIQYKLNFGIVTAAFRNDVGND